MQLEKLMWNTQWHLLAVENWIYTTSVGTVSCSKRSEQGILICVKHVFSLFRSQSMHTGGDNWMIQPNRKDGVVVISCKEYRLCCHWRVTIIITCAIKGNPMEIKRYFKCLYFFGEKLCNQWNVAKRHWNDNRSKYIFCFCPVCFFALLSNLYSQLFSAI